MGEIFIVNVDIVSQLGTRKYTANMEVNGKVFTLFGLMKRQEYIVEKLEKKKFLGFINGYSATTDKGTLDFVITVLSKNKAEFKEYAENF